MHANALRTILLVKSVEDHDADGAMLTLAEREAATRGALRAHPGPAAEATAEAREARTWRVLDARARDLHGRLVQRHPVVARTVLLESRATQAAFAMLLVAFGVGLALSVLDSRVRIEIVAFPLLGLVLWNLVVYAVLAVATLRRPRSRAPGAVSTAAGWVAWPLRWGWRRAASLVRQASFYHRPLASALRRFSEEWWPLAQPLLALEGRRIFHLAAAAVALGLVAGFYVRGIALEYRAGWESTFLTPTQVRGALHVLYGPASAATGIALPADDAAIEALHWRDGAGGGPAAGWIHLIAATAILFVVLPRLWLAILASIALVRASRRIAPPDLLLPYARRVLGASDAAPAAVAVRVIPYAYHPAQASLDGLGKLLHATYGPGTRVDLATAVAYGDEAALRRLEPATSHGLEILLFTLAATPEVENHGAVLVAARDALAAAKSPTRLVALVDEAPLLAHMRGDASLASRVDERRDAWREFGARHGYEVCLADLAALAAAQDVSQDLIARLRASARPVPA
ncbi:MAG TPA: DUF2868 domain-containing protein [Steroidobacteraceae bacterium]|nr:DUF2868 domain-containing protein [Steroidobacteraceae bacterium]